jgi:hypothetical protein
MNTTVPSLVIVLVLGGLAFRLYSDWLFLRRPRRNALGSIIDYRRISDEGGQLSRPIIRFESDDGQTVEFTNAWGWRSHELAVGSLIAVEYPGGRPDKARIVGSYSPWRAYGLSVAVLALLIAFITVAK